MIKTYNDLLALGENEKERTTFVFEAIRLHKSGNDYMTACDAELYYKHQNPTIMRYQKFVHNRFGQKVPNTWSANNKIASNWYNYFVTQGVSYLLGNGVTFGNEQTKNKLGKKFDKMILDAAIAAKNGAVSFGFWNYDHLEIFEYTKFVPLWDEEDGGLKAGIRFWQIDSNKPLRCTLYEIDGYTDYIKRKDEKPVILTPKKSYKNIVQSTEAEGVEILDGGNYPTFPIVPFWNINKQSELVGNRGTIDAYDLMISGLINNVSDGEFLYWILTNCDGMSDDEVCQFIEGLALNHVAKAGDGSTGSKVDAHKAEVPFEASSEALDRLKERLYNDFMALNVEQISSQNVTATQIIAAYEPINQKTDQFESCVTDFIDGILALAGIDDKPTYTRSQMSNQGETADIVLQSAEHLDDKYVTEKILTLLGDQDKIEKVMERKTVEEVSRYSQVNEKTSSNSLDEDEI